MLVLIKKIPSCIIPICIKKWKCQFCVSLIALMILFLTGGCTTLAGDSSNSIASSCGSSNPTLSSVSPNLEESSVQQLSSDEQNIADAIVHFLHDLMDQEFIENPEVFSFEGATVEVTYIQEYIWYEPNKPDETLLAMAPEGITVFLPVPAAPEGQDSQYRPNLYVFNLGKKDDGTYIGDDSYIGLAPHSAEEYFDSLYQRPDVTLHKFELYIPPR